jgi:hypothetical protein
MKKFETKDYINYALSFAGIVVTVALIAKPEKIEVIKNEYFVPMRELVQVEKQEEKVVTVTQAIEEVKKEVQVTPKVAPVTPVKEEVKKEPVKEVVQEVKEEPVQEVKENPFEVVRHDFTYTTEETGELCVQNVKVNVTATNRQGTLERVSKINIVYMEGNNEIKNDFVKEVQKDQNKDTFDFRGVLCSEYNVSIKVRATSFTNYGGDVKYYTSDWFAIK